MNVVMIGAGYVGLVSGTCFAETGHHVICVEKHSGRLESLLRNVIPIYEPGLDEMVAANVAAGRLSFTGDLAEAMKTCDIVFIAVGTPSRKSDGHADMTYVHDAVREIAANASTRFVLVTKSTVAVGTGDEAERILAETLPREQFAVVSNPEFLKEGAAIDDFINPDRIVVGTEDDWAVDVLAELYKPLTDKGAPILFTRRRTAELIKYAANAFLATKITFINEIANLCEKVGADVLDVAKGIGLDSRIGDKFLQAGPGYGGSCFPKDTLELVNTAQEYESPVHIVEAAIKVNDLRKRAMARKVANAMGGDVRGRRIAILGLTFKAETDDMRDAPSISIVQALSDRGARITAFDPQGMAEAAHIMPDIAMAEDAYAAAEGADAVVIVTEWKQFRELDLDRLKAQLAQPLMVDLRNLFSPADMAARGFDYVSLGR
jgi:UDPglucose 6-dehydrogenase